MTDTLSITKLLWSDIAEIYAKVLAHPFIAGLTDGTLPRESFRHYIIQDAHYLRGYARALAVCAAKAPVEGDTAMFVQHAAGAIAAEQDLHAELMAALGSSADAAAAESVAPTTRAYLSYLLATTYGGSYAEGVAAVLPCYWIYAKVGEELLARSSPDPLYARWIAMYGGSDFQVVVDEVLAVTERIGAELTARELEQVREHFRTTSRYEWMFWDAGYRRESWPV
ncbi:thiaminase II [Pseudonocardia asaccharolytica]|uniref:Aminopyrimidine aminohydrolase n=1 Tax=Pseudonocardia asaccharolytica DSM 44247 = NBRC 16224 TaxID=1123024 RepID=A0A511CV41_9PSEU|nr:thiaminase II [Pseudonocardia asaccharolytica]GEL16317.1 aminopyrimidine aminohydrolase [Pseudonocardia asaccharolytica DSM 44247 = NBRC 16224]